MKQSHKLEQHRVSITAELNKLEKSRVRLDITVGTEKVKETFAKTYSSIAAKAHIKGFRPGKAPAGVIRMKYGSSIARDVAETLIKEAFEAAVEQHGLRPIGGAELTSELPELNEESSLALSIETDVYPEVAIPNYEGLAVGAVRYEVSESDVDKELEKIVESRAKFEDKPEGVLAADDLAVVNYEVFVDGEAKESMKREGYSYDLKTGAKYPDFQDGLRGKTTGESFELPSKIPEDFPLADIAGKDVVFKGEIVKMQKRILPVVDDAFAAEVSDKKTLAELRELLLERMREHAKSCESSETRKKLLELLADKMEFAVPKCMIDAHVDDVLETLKNSARRSGRDLDGELAAEGKTIESFREQFEADAIREIRKQLLIHEIAEKEKLEPSAEEINEALDDYARYYGTDRETLREHFTKSGEMSNLALRIVRRKVLETLEKAASITVEKTLPFAEMKA